MRGTLNRHWMHLALCAVALAASVGYYSFPMTEVPIGVDSAVFSYVGEVVAAGGAPYADVFDHKGPVVYLLNSIGALGPSTWALWLVEWVFLAASLCLCYETGRAVGVPRLAAVAIPVLVVPYIVYRAEGGNLTEEYCLPFMFATLLVAVRVLKGAPARLPHAFLAGACAACVFMIRFTALIGLVLFYIALAAVVWARRGPRRLFCCLGMFAAGFAAVAGPLVGWLAASGALQGFAEQYFAFNVAYAGDVGAGDRWSSLGYFARDAMLVLAVAATAVSLVLCWARRHPKCGREMVVVLVNFAGLALLFAYVALSGRSYGHYLLMFVPGCAMALYQVVLQAGRLARSRAAMASAGVALMLSVVYFPSGFASVHEVLYRSTLADTRAAVVDEVREAAGGGTVLAVGNECWVYLDGSFRAPVPYAYRSDAMPAAYDAWLAELVASDSAPAAIVVADYVDLEVPLDSYCQAAVVEGFTVYRHR